MDKLFLTERDFGTALYMHLHLTLVPSVLSTLRECTPKWVNLVSLEHHYCGGP